MTLTYVRFPFMPPPRTSPSRRTSWSFSTCIATLALLAGSLALGGCSDSDSAAERLASAREYAEQGELTAAIIELKNGLQADAEHAESRAALGRLFLLTGDGAAAAKELGRAIQYGLTTPEVLLARARAELMQGKSERARTTLSAVPAGYEPSARAELEGAINLFENAPDAAVEFFEQAIELDEANAEARLGLASVAWRKGDAAAVARHVSDVLERKPDHVGALLMQGELALTLGQGEDAEATFMRACELVPDRAAADYRRAYSGAARAQLALGNTEAAGKSIAALHKSWPGHPYYRYLSALLARQQGDLEKTEDILRDVLKTLPDNPPSLLLLGALQYQRGQLEQAREYLRRYVVVRPDEPTGRKLLGAVSLKLGEPAAAIEVLAADLESGGDDPQYLGMLGSAYMAMGQYEKASDFLERAGRVSAEGGAARRLGLGQGRGESDLLVVLRDKLETEPEFHEGRFVLANELLNRAQYDDALEVARSLADRLPDNPVPLNLQGRILKAMGDPEGARDAYRKSLERDPGFAPAAVNLALMMLDEGQLDKAREGFESVLEKRAGFSPALLGLARVEMHADNVPQAIALLEKLRLSDTRAVEPRVLLANLLIAQARHDDALAVAREALDLAPYRREVLLAMSRAQLGAGRPDTSRDTAKVLVARAPDWVHAHMQLGYAAKAAQHFDEAREAFQQALEIDPELVAARYALVAIESESGDPQQVLTMAGELSGLYPESVDAKVQLIKAQLLAGESQLAVDTARALAQSMPDDNFGRFVLGAVYESTGQHDAAATEYRQALSIEPDSTAAHMNLARLASASGDDARARGHYRSVVEHIPGHAGALVALARMELQARRPREAIGLLTHARDANPGIVEPRLALVEAYLANGQAAEALQAAQRARELSPRSYTTTLALARAHLAAGNAQLALENARSLTSIRPNSAQAWYELSLAAREGGAAEEARAALERALAIDPEHDPSILALAQLDLAAGQPENSLQRVDQVLERRPGMAQAQLVSARALEALGANDRALQAYERAYEAEPGTVAAVGLARLLHEKGRTGDARERLVHWLEIRPDDAMARAWYGLALDADGEREAAISALERALDSDPNNLLALNNLAGYYQEAGDGRAMELAERASSIAPDSPYVLDTYGWILVQSGSLEQGIGLLERASRALPSNPAIAYRHALGLLKSGARRQAREILQRIVDSEQNFAELDSAKRLLSTLN